jgi:hypothetical protein
VTAIRIMTALRLLGIELGVDGGRLRYRAPAGGLTAEVRETLTAHKAELLVLLRRGSPARGLLDELHDKGIEVGLDGDRLRYRAPRGGIGDELRSAITAYKAEVVALLRERDRPATPEDSPAHKPDSSEDDDGVGEPRNLRRERPFTAVPLAKRDAVQEHRNPRDARDPTGPLDRANHARAAGPSAPLVPEPVRSGAVPMSLGSPQVSLGRLVISYRVWSGEVLAGATIALDTETSLIEGVQIPTLALASASSGTEHVLIHPDQLGRFLLAHQDRDIVFQNVAFDFWVICEHLKARGEAEALACWWDLADGDRLHDTMILDMLLRLALTDAYPSPRDLAIIAAEYSGLEISKSDPYRLRYAEIIGADWAAVDPGFFEYGIKDPVATWFSYEVLRQRAIEAAARSGVNEAVVHMYGPLGESIQVKGAIALAQVSRFGMHLDQKRARTVHQGFLDRLGQQMARLRGQPDAVDLFQVDRTGQVKQTKRGAPSLRTKVLQQILERIATEVAQETGQLLPITRTAKGAISTSTKLWSDFAHLHPFLADWIAMAETAKLVQFFGQLQDAVVHPSYSIMVRTGRTSCSGPNIQQIPRKGGFREIFVVRPGYGLLAGDYSFIELRTLATVCEQRYGFSVLADVIRAGTDPHCYTAAMLLGMSLDEFMALEQADPERFERLRQQAKPLNFGIPGGLGVASLVAYARSTYGVELTMDQAREFREKLIKQVYPELDLYLSEDTMAILARNLGVPVEACWARFDWSGSRSPAIAGGIRNLVRGKTRKADGTLYNSGFTERTWDGLIALAGDSELAPLLAGRRGSEDLERRLFRSGVTTLTGRVRGRVSFSQARNTPFQGLAADGAKLALWDLIKEGYPVIGFIHDEVLVALPSATGVIAVEEAEKVIAIMCRSMEVVTGNVPVACKYTWSRRWSKDAKAIVRDGQLIAWEPAALA